MTKITDYRTPIHPGEILADELQEISLSAKKLADCYRSAAQPALSDPCGKAKRDHGHGPALSQYFGMSADFWMNPQSAYEFGPGAAAERQGHSANSEAQRYARAAGFGVMSCSIIAWITPNEAERNQVGS